MKITANTKVKVWSLYTPIILLVPVLNLIKYIYNNTGISFDGCLYALRTYFILSCIFMACGFMARYDLLYGYFLTNSRRYGSSISLVLGLLYLGAFSLIGGVFYLANLKGLVYNFLENGDIIHLLKFSAVFPFSIVSVSLVFCHLTALRRGQMGPLQRKYSEIP